MSPETATQAHLEVRDIPDDSRLVLAPYLLLLWLNVHALRLQKPRPLAPVVLSHQFPDWLDDAPRLDRTWRDGAETSKSFICYVLCAPQVQAENELHESQVILLKCLIIFYQQKVIFQTHNYEPSKYLE